MWNGSSLWNFEAYGLELTYIFLWLKVTRYTFRLHLNFQKWAWNRPIAFIWYSVNLGQMNFKQCWFKRRYQKLFRITSCLNVTLYIQLMAWIWNRKWDWNLAMLLLIKVEIDIDINYSTLNTLRLVLQSSDFSIKVIYLLFVWCIHVYQLIINFHGQEDLVRVKRRCEYVQYYYLHCFNKHTSRSSIYCNVALKKTRNH